MWVRPVVFLCTMCVQVATEARGLGSPATGATGCYDRPVMVLWMGRNQTQVLCESRKYSSPLSHFSNPQENTFWGRKKTSAIQWDVKNINLSKSIFDKKKKLPY